MGVKKFYIQTFITYIECFVSTVGPPLSDKWRRHFLDSTPTPVQSGDRVSEMFFPFTAEWRVWETNITDQTLCQ